MTAYKLIFIGPFGFSGSTLLDLALAQSQQIVTTGEMFQLGEWLRDDNLCTCKAPVSQCQFWSTIIANAPHSTLLRPDGISALDDYRTRPLTVTPELKVYAERAWQTVDRIAAETGARYVIDSSKHLWRLRALALERPEAIVFVHLHRSAPVVARSARMSKARPATSGEATTPAVPYIKTLSKWILTNRAAARFADMAGITRIPLRYETLSAQPESILSDLCTRLQVPYINAMRMPRVSGNHNIAGSRWRMNKEVVHITSANATPAGAPERALTQLCDLLGGIK